MRLWEVDMSDALRDLCQVLYGRKETAGDWLGGSNAKIFIDAAESITTLRQQLADMTARAEEAEKVAQRLYQKLDGMIV
jgi:hypothetical protein